MKPPTRVLVAFDDGWPKRLHNWKPVFGCKLLGNSMGRVLGILKGKLQPRLGWSVFLAEALLPRWLIIRGTCALASLSLSNTFRHTFLDFSPLFLTCDRDRDLKPITRVLVAVGVGWPNHLAVFSFL